MDIDEVIERLIELKNKHGILPVYFLFDSFVNAPVSRIEFGQETKDHTIAENIIPERVVLMCPADENDWDE